MPLIPPWAPDAQKPGFKKYSATRKAWSAIGEELGTIWKNPLIQSNSLQMTAAAKRGASGEMKRLSKEYQAVVRDITEKVREQVRQNPPPNADRELVELYLRMTDLPYTNRVERAALSREIAPRLGQLPHEGDRPTPAALALSATHGGVSRHGLLIEIRWMGLADPTKGAPALLDWICAKNCRQIKYDFEGSPSFGGLGDDE